jgi:hypothetical protein
MGTPLNTPTNLVATTTTTTANSNCSNITSLGVGVGGDTPQHPTMMTVGDLQALQQGLLMAENSSLVQALCQSLLTAMPCAALQTSHSQSTVCGYRARGQFWCPGGPKIVQLFGAQRQ